MKETNQPFGLIGVVGLGLIGGSIALDLQSLGLQVRGLTSRKESAIKAQCRGLAQVVSTSPEILKDCDLIILALPLNQLIKPNKKLIDSLPEEAVITDVGSVKEPILHTWENLHPKFVPSHPMAGNNKSGIEAGARHLFKDRPWVSTPNSKTDLRALSLIKEMATMLGSKWITTDAKSHDQAVAFISHLPVIISASLLSMIQTQTNKDLYFLMKELASSGFSDTTRIGGGNPKLGRDMSSNNTSAILDGLDLYKTSITRFEKLLTEKNWSKLEEELKNTKKIRDAFFPS